MKQMKKVFVVGSLLAVWAAHSFSHDFFERQMRLIDDLNQDFQRMWEPVVGEVKSDPASIQRSGLTRLGRHLDESTDAVCRIADQLKDFEDEDDASDVISGIMKDIKHGHEKLKKASDDLKSEIERLSSKVVNVDKGVGRYTISESITDDKKHQIVIALPGFDEKEIKVTISKEEQQGLVRHVLEVTGTHKQEPGSGDDSEQKPSSKSVIQASKRAYSMQSINGRKRIIEEKDGQLNIKIDLPRAIDVDDYDMKLKDGKLVVDFALAGQGSARKSLLFGSIK